MIVFFELFFPIKLRWETQKRKIMNDTTQFANFVILFELDHEKLSSFMLSIAVYKTVLIGKGLAYHETSEF